MATKKKAVTAKKQVPTPKRKIWVSIIGFSGDVEHTEIDDSHMFYKAAMTTGTYNLSKSSAMLVWGAGLKLMEGLRKFDEEVLEIEDLINKVKSKTKKK